MNWGDEVALGVLGLFLVTLAVLSALLWAFHKHHDDSSDEPVHLPTERAPTKRLRDPIDLSEGQRCPCCHGDLAHQEGLHRCRDCSTILHWECYRDLGCPTFGCAGAFAKRKDTTPCDGDAPERRDDDPGLEISVKSKA